MKQGYQLTDKYRPSSYEGVIRVIESPNHFEYQIQMQAALGRNYEYNIINILDLDNGKLLYNGIVNKIPKLATKVDLNKHDRKFQEALDIMYKIDKSLGIKKEKYIHKQQNKDKQDTIILD